MKPATRAGCIEIIRFGKVEKKLCVIFASNHYDIPTLRSIFADGRGR
jgi:hypothetical protein